MKHIGRELFNIIEKKKLIKRQIALQCDLDPSYFSQLMNKSNIDCEKLEKICKAIGISPGYFFDDWPSDATTISEIKNMGIMRDTNIHNNTYNDCALQDLLDAKDLIIETKDALIQEKERTIQRLLSMQENKSDIDAQ